MKELSDTTNGDISGVTRLSHIWLIPKDAPKPIDGHTKVAIEYNELSETKTTN